MLLISLLYINVISISSTNQCYDAWECQSQELIGSVSCYGYQACESSIITSSYYVPCSGYKSCMNADITTTNTIACNGDYACSNAKISSPDVLRCHGNSGCWSAEIDAVNIIADGVQALNTANIDSTNQVRINVYSKGYLSGMNANIICRSGKMCNVYCEGSGCQDLNFGCLEGSTCTVSPSVCSPFNQNDISESMKDDASASIDDNNNEAPYPDDDATVTSVICPNWYLSGSKQIDEVILTRLDQKRMDVIKAMELESPQDIDGDLLDPIRYLQQDDEELYHSRGFGVRGSNKQDNAYSDNGHNNQQVFGNDGIHSHIHTAIIMIIILCSAIIIGAASWFCYRHSRPSKNDPAANFSEHSPLLDQVAIDQPESYIN